MMFLDQLHTYLCLIERASISTLKFTKTKEGAIIQVLVHNKDLWKKANDYKP